MIGITRKINNFAILQLIVTKLVVLVKKLNKQQLVLDTNIRFVCVVPALLWRSFHSLPGAAFTMLELVILVGTYRSSLELKFKSKSPNSRMSLDLYFWGFFCKTTKLSLNADTNLVVIYNKCWSLINQDHQLISRSLSLKGNIKAWYKVKYYLHFWNYGLSLNSQQNHVDLIGFIKVLSKLGDCTQKPVWALLFLLSSWSFIGSLQGSKLFVI